MMNDRVGLICATLQNGIPVIQVRKSPSKMHKPQDYFRKASPDKSEAREKPGRLERAQRIWDNMMAYCGVKK